MKTPIELERGGNVQLVTPRRPSSYLQHRANSSNCTDSQLQCQAKSTLIHSLEPDQGTQPFQPGARSTLIHLAFRLAINLITMSKARKSTAVQKAHQSERDEDEPTPLPYPPIIALCAGRVVEGLIFSVIFPYINAQVHDIGVAEEDVGKWSAAAVRPTQSQATHRSLNLGLEKWLRDPAHTDARYHRKLSTFSLPHCPVPSSDILATDSVVVQSTSSVYSGGWWGVWCLGL